MEAEAETETAVLEIMRTLSSENQRAVLSYALFLRHQRDNHHVDAATDETDYLLRSPANREKLLAAVADVEAGRNVIIPDQTPFQ